MGTSWIYQLKKEELIVELENRQLDTSGGVEELRKRLSEYIKENEATGNSNKEIKNPKPTQSNFQPVLRLRMTPPQPNELNFSPPQNVPVLGPNDAEVLEIVRKWNVHFDGGNDALEFLERFEELATLYSIPFDRLTRTLPDKLRSRALEWFRNNHNQFQNWLEFKTEFQNYFLSHRHRIKLEDDIRRRSQGPREKGKDYVTTMQTMYRRLGQVPVNDQLERIYENLRTEYRLYIRRQDFRTLSELLIFIEQYEELMREQPRHTIHGIHDGPNTSNTLIEKSPVTRPPTPNLSRRPNPFNVPIPGWPGTISASQPPPPLFIRETHCWRCGQHGHTRFNCPNAYTPLCSFCGRRGNSRQCPCQSENGQWGPSFPNV